MRAKTTEELILIEIDEIDLEVLEELHNFLRESNINPIRKVEVKNVHKDKPGTGHYSGCVKGSQLKILKEWLESKGVAPVAT